MKKIISSFVFFLIFASMNAKPARVPEWVNDFRKVFPNTEYIAQRGSGDSAEKAKADATAALSKYFQTNVSVNLSATKSFITEGDFVEEKTALIDEVSIQSQVDLFGLEYTDPYYLKAEKKWYSVVYINRKEAWMQYKPQIDISKNSFNGLYKNMEKESDFFSKLEMIKIVWKSGQELLQKLEFGRIINPEEESVYQIERDKIAEIPVVFEEAKQNCSIYIQINNDYGKLLTASLSNTFRDCGLKVSKTAEDSNYVAEVFVDENITGNDPLSIKPGVSVNILSKTGKTVYNYEVLSSEKSIGYTLESAQKKAYPKLAEKLGESVKEKMQIFMKL